MQSLRVAGLAVAMAAAGLMALHAVAGETPLVPAQAIYVERCGGCHGIQGVSAAREVPTLRGRAAEFLCVPEGRAYLVRLPSVAGSPLDDAEVADLMNFVVFELGVGRAHGQQRYTVAEVAALREQPLTGDGLTRLRQRLVTQLIEQCGAPRDMSDYVGPVTDAGGS